MTATTEQTIVTASHNGGLWRNSGVVLRGDQSPKYAAKKRGSAAVYVPGSSAGFVPSATNWNMFVFSRDGTVSTSTPARARLNGGTVDATATLENGASDLSVFLAGATRNGDGTFTNYFKGKIAVWATWDRVLSAAEEDQLFAGTRPESVSGGAPNFIAEFSGSGIANTFVTPSGHTINFTGSPTLDTDSPYSLQSIISINDGAGIRIGSTGNIARSSGFTTAPTTVMIGSLAGTVTNYNPVNGDITFSVPAPVHTIAYPDIASTQTVTFSNGAGESSSLTSVPFSPPLGSTTVTVSSPVTNDDRYLGYWMILSLGVTPANGDKFYGIDADVTWTADTGGSATSLPVTTPVVYWDASTGTAYLLNVTVNPDGVVSEVGKASLIGIGFGIGIGF